MPVFFNGRLLVTPTVESVVDDSAMLSHNLATGNVLAIIGRSKGGAPKTPLTLRSPTHAREVLQDGELLAAAEKAFAPSTETRGPASVIAVRVNPAVQASLTLNDAAGSPVIDLVSTDYGLYTNQIKVKLESGTNSGKKLTTEIGQGYYSKDNVARDAFTIGYSTSASGAQASGTVTVNETQVVLSAPAGTPVATIDLNVYDTVQKLVDRINTAGAGWSAAVVPGSANTTALRGLDALNAQDVSNATFTVTAHLQAAVDWFNSVMEGFVTATRHAGAGAVPANLPFTYLAGGSDGNVLASDWADCFTALQSQDVQWVVPLSSDVAVWAMADAHASFMSGVGHMERRVFVGGGLGLTKSNATEHAALLNSDRTAYVYPGYYDTDANGDMTLYPPYMLAAMLGSAFASLNPGETMTNKSLRMLGLEADIHAPSDTDDLINGGVLTVTSSQRGFRVAKAVTTWLNDSKYNRTEVSCGAATDYVVRSVREALQTFVGAKASPLSLHQAVSRTESVLRELAREEPAGPGVLVGDSDHPPYRNITAVIDGDVLRVEFECSPVIPLNYVLVTVHAVPYSSN